MKLTEEIKQAFDLFNLPYNSDLDTVDSEFQSILASCRQAGSYKIDINRLKTYTEAHDLITNYLNLGESEKLMDELRSEKFKASTSRSLEDGYSGALRNQANISFKFNDESVYRSIEKSIQDDINDALNNRVTEDIKNKADYVDEVYNNCAKDISFSIGVTSAILLAILVILYLCNIRLNGIFYGQMMLLIVTIFMLGIRRDGTLIVKYILYEFPNNTLQIYLRNKIKEYKQKNFSEYHLIYKYSYTDNTLRCDIETASGSLSYGVTFRNAEELADARIESWKNQIENNDILIKYGSETGINLDDTTKLMKITVSEESNNIDCNKQCICLSDNKNNQIIFMPDCILHIQDCVIHIYFYHKLNIIYSTVFLNVDDTKFRHANVLYDVENSKSAISVRAADIRVRYGNTFGIAIFTANEKYISDDIVNMF